VLGGLTEHNLSCPVNIIKVKCDTSVAEGVAAFAS